MPLDEEMLGLSAVGTGWVGSALGAALGPEHCWAQCSQEEKREGCRVWASCHRSHSPVLNHDVGPECVQELLPVALSFEVHQLGLEAHAAEQRERLMVPGML